MRRRPIGVCQSALTGLWPVTGGLDGWQRTHVPPCVKRSGGRYAPSHQHGAKRAPCAYESTKVSMKLRGNDRDVSRGRRTALGPIRGLNDCLASGWRHGRWLEPGCVPPPSNDEIYKDGACGIPLNYKRRTLPTEKRDNTWEAWV